VRVTDDQFEGGASVALSINATRHSVSVSV